ncbi:DUF1049 domain-containing protein [Mesobacillus boroniphilus]|uniref:DUF1049 domain-containing protein n=1 Tax=Mesobacillus boroniphilus TaxID=308892 RepID=A0A944CKK5_9BACI|nr:lipopolysaccharide assembly protein LapA domain-containing protein [Mesobacillus boroniphilus]MBS8265035.1 DUF1049 domain-containing protein [Mesobacillus boroniphilus]
MKFQWTLLLGLAFALIVAVFAVINVDPVTVNYLFGESEWPLILVILGSVLMGGIIVGSVGLFRLFVLQREVKALKKKNKGLEDQLAQKDTVQEDPAHKQQIEDIH